MGVASARQGISTTSCLSQRPPHDQGHAGKSTHITRLSLGPRISRRGQTLTFVRLHLPGKPAPRVRAEPQHGPASGLVDAYEHSIRVHARTNLSARGAAIPAVTVPPPS